MSSIIYKSPLVYNLAIRALYTSNFTDRYIQISNIISSGSSVVELCCGDMYLYRKFLSQKHIQYTGIDNSSAFYSYAIKHDIKFLHQDVFNAQIPQADFVIMQASLYHFLPNPEKLVRSMIAASGMAAIIAEPVKNIAQSSNLILRFLSKVLSTPAASNQYANLRFNNDSFQHFCDQFVELKALSPIANGREMLAIFNKIT